MTIDRREFIRLLGGVGGSLALGAYGLNQVFEVPDKLIEEAKYGPRITTWKSTICGFCPGGCGLQFRLVDGLPVYVKGNPNYPVNSGGVCPLAHSSLELLYHPERLKEPLKRIGVAGSGKFEPVSWDNAIDMITQKLSALRDAGHPEKFAFLGSSESGLQESFIKSFLSNHGSPNYFKFSFESNNSAASYLQFGRNTIPSYDIPNANVVLLLGSNILETENSPVYNTKLFSLAKSASKNKTTFISVSPRMDLTGMNADKWVPIKPGTFAAFALGIAYVLIREEMFDKNFINNFAFGFYKWSDKYGGSHRGFQEFVIGNYYPEKVSEITGVPSETILGIAREIGNNKPSVVIGGETILNNSNGVFSQMAVNSLNALLGNFGKEGGVIFPSENPLGKPDFVKLDKTAKEGLQQPRIDSSQEGIFPLTEFSIEQFSNNVLAGKPYSLEVLFMYKGNPGFQTLNKHNFHDALKKIPMVVSFDSFINESNIFADLILPLNTFVEEWDEVSAPGVSFQHVGIRNPIVETFYNTKQLPDILLTINKKFGGTTNSYSFSSYKELIQERANKLFLSGAGAVTTEKIGSRWLEFIRVRGWHIGRYESFDEFWKLIVSNGGWWDPSVKPMETNKIFKTRSQKFEFYSTALEKTLNTGKAIDERSLNKLNISARGDTIFMAHHETPPHSENIPLHLIIFRKITNRDGSAANLPLMQEMMGYGIREYWGTWAEINPSTAKKYQIKSNDEIWISSDIGSIKVRAKICPGVAEDVVAVPFGLGHTSYGKYANGYGENPTEIIKNQYDMLSGKPAYLATKVSVSKTTGEV